MATPSSAKATVISAAAGTETRSSHGPGGGETSFATGASLTETNKLGASVSRPRAWGCGRTSPRITSPVAVSSGGRRTVPRSRSHAELGSNSSSNKPVHAVKRRAKAPPAKGVRSRMGMDARGKETARSLAILPTGS